MIYCVWGGLALLLLGAVIYWQFILAEGTYFGARLVTLLYDWSAEKYNNIKAFDEGDENLTLGRPLAGRLRNQPNALVLDVATGTGRMPLVLMRQPAFKGRVIGLDRSARMLAVAQRDTAQLKMRVILIQADAMALPFANNSLPLVTCLEVLEFLPNPQHGLEELVRVLQPSDQKHPNRGWLLTTNRIGWEASLMPGKTWSRHRLETILADLPLQHVAILPWQTIYDQVWGQKVNSGK